MDHSSAARDWPPGTVKLTAGDSNRVVLHPKPTDDYDDPLNWSRRRKAVHFGIVIVYVSISFTLIDAHSVTRVQTKGELGLSSANLAAGKALEFTGLGLAGILLIPLAYRYGRRSSYVISILIQLLSAIWLANVQSVAQYLASSLLSGLGAAVAQTLVPMTIVDLFFMHQFATAYGWFMFAQGAGAFLGPVIAGFIVSSYGWRAIWWWLAGLLAGTLLLVLFFLEESTFVPNTQSQTEAMAHHHYHNPEAWRQSLDSLDLVDMNRNLIIGTLDLPPGPRPLKKRFAFITQTRRPIKERFLSPFVILFRFPAVAYAAVTYGAIMAWLALFVHISSTELVSSPYDFNPKSLGLFSLAPFIGHSLGSLLVPLLSDFCIVRLAKRNDGVYVPEMRLRLAIPGAAFVCVGIVVFGLGASQHAPWQVMAFGFAVFAFGFTICLVVALSYITDCYQNMIGDALVGVVFVRNTLAVTLSLGIIPWINALGMESVFLSATVIAVLLLLVPIPMMLWGQKSRKATAALYRHHSLAAIPPATWNELMKDGLRQN